MRKSALGFPPRSARLRLTVFASNTVALSTIRTPPTSQRAPISMVTVLSLVWHVTALSAGFLIGGASLKAGAFATCYGAF